MERKAWTAVVVLTGLLGLAGFYMSFERVSERMVPYFGDRAWIVPLAVDLGILVFTALDLLMAYRDIRSVWLRYVPWALVAVTIYLNVVGETALEGQVAHVALPGMWVIAVEVAGIAVRSIFGLHSDRARMDRVPRTMWLLAPRSTLRLRRRMILRRETSLAAASDRDLGYQLARADLRDEYGWLGLGWRIRAPRRAKILLRRGAVTPSGHLALELEPAEAEWPDEPDAGAADQRTPVEEEDHAGPNHIGRDRRGQVEGDDAETRVVDDGEDHGGDHADLRTGGGPGPSDAGGGQGTAPGGPPAVRVAASRDRRSSGPGRGPRGKTNAVDDATLMAAEDIADQLEAEGLSVSRRSVLPRLRQKGYSIGTNRARPLMAHLQQRAAARAAGRTSGDREPVGVS